jgi:hypothetical protein
MSDSLRKFIAVDADTYQQLKKNFLEQKHLTNLEKNILEVLKSSNFSESKRLDLYYRLLLKNSNNTPLQTFEKNTQTTNRIENNYIPNGIINSNEQDTQTINEVENNNNNFPTKLISLSEQGTQTLKPRKSFIPVRKTLNQETQTFESPKPEVKTSGNEKKYRESIYESFPKHQSENLPHNDNDEMMIDPDNEKQKLVDEILTHSTENIRLNKSKIRGLEDPEKDYFVVESENGEVLTIDKPQHLHELQKKMVKKKRVVGVQPLDKTPSPRRSRAKPKQAQTGQGSSWITYENVMKNNY